MQVLLSPVDRESSLPVGSYLRHPLAGSAQKRPLTAAQQETVKRRKVQTEQYGAPVEELDPDRPVKSRERDVGPAEEQGMGAVEEASVDGREAGSNGENTGSQKEEARTDKDGFKVPFKVQTQLRLDQDGFKMPAPKTKSKTPIPKSKAEIFRLQREHARSISRDRSKGAETETPTSAQAQKKAPSFSPELGSPLPEQLATSAGAEPDAEPVALQDQTVQEEENGQATDYASNVTTPSPGPEAQPVAYFLQKPSSFPLPNGSIGSSGGTPNSAIVTPSGSAQRAKSRPPPASINNLKPQITHDASVNSQPPQKRFKTIEPTSPLSIWTQADELKIDHAIRNNIDSRKLKEMYFPTKSLETVMQKLSEMRKSVQAADEEAASAEYSKKRHEEQVVNGTPSTKAGEPYTQEEEELLLAAKLEGAELKRIAKEHFPLRTYEGVKRHASKLWNDAARSAKKALQTPQSTNARGKPLSSKMDKTPQPTSTPPQPSAADILEALHPAQRQRVARKQEEVKADKAKFNEDRGREMEEKEKSKQAVSARRTRSNSQKARESEQTAFLKQREDQEAKQEDIATRRLKEDLRNNRDYAELYRSYEQDKNAGKAVGASPQRPRGSAIGTEIAVSSVESKAFEQDMPPPSATQSSGGTRRSVSFNTDINKSPQHSSSPTLTRKAAPGNGILKRRRSPEVVVISPRLRRTMDENAATATPVATNEGRPDPKRAERGTSRLISSVASRKTDKPRTRTGSSSSGPAFQDEASKPAVTYSHKKRNATGQFASGTAQSTQKSRGEGKVTTALSGAAKATPKSSGVAKATPKSSGVAKSTPRAARSTPNSSAKLPQLPLKSSSPIEISSNSESSEYSDSDLDDEVLSRAAERSSQERALQSSQASDKSTNTPLAQEKKLLTANVMKVTEVQDSLGNSWRSINDNWPTSTAPQVKGSSLLSQASASPVKVKSSAPAKMNAPESTSDGDDPGKQLLREENHARSSSISQPAAATNRVGEDTTQSQSQSQASRGHGSQPSAEESQAFQTQDASTIRLQKQKRRRTRSRSTRRSSSVAPGRQNQASQASQAPQPLSDGLTPITPRGRRRSSTVGPPPSQTLKAQGSAVNGSQKDDISKPSQDSTPNQTAGDDVEMDDLRAFIKAREGVKNDEPSTATTPPSTKQKFSESQSQPVNGTARSSQPIPSQHTMLTQTFADSFHNPPTSNGRPKAASKPSPASLHADADDDSLPLPSPSSALKAHTAIDDEAEEAPSSPSPSPSPAPSPSPSPSASESADEEIVGRRSEDEDSEEEMSAMDHDEAALMGLERGYPVDTDMYPHVLDAFRQTHGEGLRVTPRGSGSRAASEWRGLSADGEAEAEAEAEAEEGIEAELPQLESQTIGASQASVRTADLAPPFPSSGRVRKTQSQSQEQSLKVSQSQKASQSQRSKNEPLTPSTTGRLNGAKTVAKTPATKTPATTTPATKAPAKTPAKTPATMPKLSGAKTTGTGKGTGTGKLPSRGLSAKLGLKPFLSQGGGGLGGFALGRAANSAHGGGKDEKDGRGSGNGSSASGSGSEDSSSDDSDEETTEGALARIASMAKEVERKAWARSR